MNKSELLENFFDTSAKIKRLVVQMSSDSSHDRMATLFQLQVLAYLSHNDAITPSQIADNFCMSSSSVAQLTDRLITSKWVERFHDDKDRRVVHLSLSPAGREELDRLKKIRRERFEPFLKLIDESDLISLVTILDKIYESMEKEVQGVNK
ncbi:hypothetical protein BH09PAT1_BH09PAT1_4620 [soil metagenome]